MRGGRRRGRPMIRRHPMMGRHHHRHRPCCGCCGGCIVCLILLFLIILVFGFAFITNLFAIFF
ncbi:MAG: hypothetical protein ACFFEV_10545 [Candidatus Thorarchaeota archaeon]